MARIQDPTADEMRVFLVTQTCGDDMGDDIEVAIYWFANDYHGGQASNLYSALCMSPYSPGPISTLESEGDGAVMLYEALEFEYAGKEG